ncbi:MULTISPECIES: hypothetical protein [Bacillus subtilis group]|uniref:hypothetical protein n=1 Tax=Bacillus TaxID=1386 RepID=UPI00119E9614|nr:MULTISPECIES: hypothetical protein [Bacillus subtilis group]MBT3123369.1 hypothetical protein [Bacillus inaquosorum]MCB5337157.1 hypothetical protein [Bacillus amyloliquefaciens]MCF7615483.1 hypothetical protein [Bacillus subtilis]QWK35398.1 hypothetical protein KM843_19765 [Bacillus velezensis]
MKSEILMKVVNSGKLPVVRVTDGIVEHFQEGLDPGMLVKVKGVTTTDDGEIEILLDLEPFIDHNKSVANPNFYNSKGEAVLTWFETNFYPDSGIYLIGFLEDADLPFEFTENNSLLNEYVAEGSDKGYVEWLEDRVQMLEGNK